MPEPAISIRGLQKRYGDVEAIHGIDLEVQPGEVFAFLGPNGAGKTTTVEILEGYRKRSGGEATVLGEDPERAGRGWRERIGIVLQGGRLDPYLTVRESLALYAGYYSSPRPVDEVIETVGLGGKAGERTGRLSGGQQRRLDVGLALIGDPELLFLDEPTTGFDPSARRQAWETIAGLRDLGKTVFLTTHYMDEAQRLADRVAIISRGEVVARGTPEDLGDRKSRPAMISFRLPEGTAVGELPADVAATLAPGEAPMGRAEASGAGGTAAPANGGVEAPTVSLSTTTPVATLNLLTGWAVERGLELEGLEVTRPSLEDVYLSLTDDGARS